jgi:hypothetical protein
MRRALISIVKLGWQAVIHNIAARQFFWEVEKSRFQTGTRGFLLELDVSLSTQIVSYPSYCNYHYLCHQDH